VASQVSPNTGPARKPPSAPCKRRAGAPRDTSAPAAGDRRRWRTLRRGTSRSPVPCWAWSWPSCPRPY